LGTGAHVVMAFNLLIGILTIAAFVYGIRLLVLTAKVIYSLRKNLVADPDEKTATPVGAAAE
ncbi:MAG: hypothetical protein ACPGXK_11195, partial [Phycisphaerae bacterium]